MWDSLTPAERKLIDDAADEAAKTQRTESRAAVAANLELLKKNGMTVTQLPPAEVTKLREEKEVTLDELIKGYQLGADYTKKTTEVAEQRKAVEAERNAINEARKARDDYSNRLQAVEEFLTSQTPQEDLASLKENDPIGYAVKVAELAEKKEQLLAVRAEQQRIANEQQAEYAQAMSERVAQEAAKLAQALPEFSDPNKGENLRKEIRAYGKSAGFTDEELDQAYQLALESGYPWTI